MRVGVVVPARDEELLLPRCLEALAVAIDRAAVACEVALVLDACTDRSAEVAAEVGARLGLPLTVLLSTAGSVGAARATGAAYLLDAQHPDRTAGDPDRAAGDPDRRAGDPVGAADDLWLATTDADSAVCEHWLSAQLAHAEAGAALVAGTVILDNTGGWSAALRRRYADRYAYPLERNGHGHVHGANLGLSARVYRSLGGFAQVGADEDVALVAAAKAAGTPITWATDLPVTTSARARGRAPRGFATTLRHLESLVELP